MYHYYPSIALDIYLKCMLHTFFQIDNAVIFIIPPVTAQLTSWVEVPEFNGRGSYLELPYQRDLAREEVRLEIWFLASLLPANALLLYQAEDNNGVGDFFSITLTDGFVKLMYKINGHLSNVT